MEKNVLEWLEKSADLYPDKVVYASEEDSLTFAKTIHQAKCLGSGILAKGTGNQPIALILNKEISTIASFLGVAYSGHPYAPIDASLPDLRIEKILEALDPSLILTSEENAEKVRKCCEGIQGLAERVELVDNLTAVEPDEENLARVRTEMTETDPLYIIFTSGSSGIPKGVVTSHHSLMCYIQAYSEVMGIEANDKLGNQSPLDYIAAIRDIYVPLLTGSSSFLIPKTYYMQPDKLAKVIIEQGITSIGWSTSAITLLTSLGFIDKHNPQTIRKICFSGSVMPGAVLRKWQQKLPDTLFVNQYGPTEATASCTYYVVDHLTGEDEMIPIGVPYRNYRIYLINEQGEAAKPGEMGEICVSGPILALGYYNNPEKTSQDFIQNPLNSRYREMIYKTGDIGCLRPDGNLEFHGRKDRQIKHMGHRIELDEVESAALAVPGIKECCVLYDPQKEVLHLFYSGEADPKKIAVMLRKTLPGFMIPRGFHPVDAVPRLPNGKMDMVTMKAIINGSV